MEVDLRSANKSTSTGKAVFFLTLAFIVGCFIGVIVYSNMTLGPERREWVASVKKSKRAREKYYKACERYAASKSWNSSECLEERTEAKGELRRAEEEECIALENFKIFRGAVNQS